MGFFYLLFFVDFIKTILSFSNLFPEVLILCSLKSLLSSHLGVHNYWEDFFVSSFSDSMPSLTFICFQILSVVMTFEFFEHWVLCLASHLSSFPILTYATLYPNSQYLFSSHRFLLHVPFFMSHTFYMFPQHKHFFYICKEFGTKHSPSHLLGVSLL